MDHQGFIADLVFYIRNLSLYGESVLGFHWMKTSFDVSAISIDGIGFYPSRSGRFSTFFDFDGIHVAGVSWDGVYTKGVVPWR